MRVIFMGSPPFSVPFLEALLQAGHEIVAVYTAPLRVRGRRGARAEHCAVASFALEKGLCLFTPASLKDPGTIAQFARMQADIAVIVAYGALLPVPILNAPKYGCLNVHPSLLPRWRGAAPIERAIEAGDEYSGVMIMRMERGLDTGDIALARKVAIEQRNALELREYLAEIGSVLLVQALEKLGTNSLTFSAQQGEPKYAHKVLKSEARINWEAPALEIANKIRAFAPFPGAWCEMRLVSHTGQEKLERVKILAANSSPNPAPASATPASNASATPSAADSASSSPAADSNAPAAPAPYYIQKKCGDSTILYISQCQKAGGRALPASLFAQAYKTIELL